MGWKNLDGTVIAISGDWSVTTDGLQWILRRRTGTDRRTGKPVWESVSFVRSTKDILARCMREKGTPPEDARKLLSWQGLGSVFRPRSWSTPKMPSQRTASPISSCFTRAHDTLCLLPSHGENRGSSPLGSATTEFRI